MQRESKTSGSTSPSTSTTSKSRSSTYACHTADAGSAPCLPQHCIILTPMQCSDAHLERHQPGLPPRLLHPQRAAHLSQHPLLLAATEADFSRTCHGLAGLSQAVPQFHMVAICVGPLCADVSLLFLSVTHLLFHLHLLAFSFTGNALIPSMCALLSWDLLMATSWPCLVSPLG